MYGAALGQETPDKRAPPLFIAAVQDDPELPALNSVEIFRRWTTSGVPAEGTTLGCVCARSSSSSAKHWNKL
jgi:hypothetical protein